MSHRQCRVEWLGQVAINKALKLQRELAAQRAAHQVPDTLLLMEHPPVYTRGFDENWEQLFISREDIAQQKIDYQPVDRNGPVIYHGPGQLVGYPILNLRELGYSYHDYIKMLEKVIIQTLAHFNVRTFSKPGRTGVWVIANSPPLSEWSHARDDEVALIATIGINLDDRNITRHGFFINVNINPDRFKLIIPHGLQGGSVTSLQQVLNKPVDIEDVIEAVVQTFCQLFNLKLSPNQSAMAA